MRKRTLTLALAIPLLCLLGIILYNLPPVYDRLAWRVENLQTLIKYSLNPPEEAVFVPQGNSGATPLASLASLTLAPTAEATGTPRPSATPTASPTPLPAAMKLDGVRYEDQHGRFNYCGPSNLSMALTFWGWEGNRDLVGQAIKPDKDDKNVMPYEMADFAQSQGLSAIYRNGGDLQLVKTLVANGFPAILEKGTFLTDLTGVYSWMGHYQTATGYDEDKGVLIVQDTYVGPDHEMTYEDIIDGWRAFNYTYIVVYPPEREAEVQAILGPRWDETTSIQIAAQIASEEIFTQTGRAWFFAWFNRGTSLMLLQDYAGAAQAYDEAFAVYAALPEEDRPWRMMWYQTGPYFAYYYTGRYADVIDLATRTLENMSKASLEESFYWRAMARAAVGDTTGAVEDYRTSLRWHPDFEPSVYQLQTLGVEP